MIINPSLVKTKVGEVVRRGYVPYWGPESADDHGVNWQVLSKEEFEEELRGALANWPIAATRHAA